VVPQAAHHVQVGHAGLDHEDVGALRGVQRRLDEGFAAVGRVLVKYQVRVRVRVVMVVVVREV
jgi:hypothetical protein